MSKRNFDNWIKAYESYADNKFAPKLFHRWAGISAVAGALERKVWLPWDETFSYFPNLFVFLVAHPGVGKSSALNKAVEMLREMNKTHGGRVTFIPSQVTEAKFIDLMSESDSYESHGKVYWQSSGYYFASEASNSLKNLYGDFIACMTDFYDCPKMWEKATVKDDKKTLSNICFNLLAGSTFDYLGKIITDDNIMGGFASRVTYVIFREKLTEEQIAEKSIFQGSTESESPERREFRNRLIEDLADIHRMVGPYQGTQEFGQLFTEWYPTYEKARQDNPSEKMQSLLVRKPTTLFKLCMILSAAESSDRVLRPNHWEAALEMTEEVEKDLPGMLREAKSSQVNTQGGMNQAIFRHFETFRGSITKDALAQHLVFNGFEPGKVDSSLEALIKGKALALENGGRLKLTVEMNSYL